MKKCFLFFAVLCALVRVSAQTNVPVKLAIISETDEALPAADLLTVKLSGNDQIQLLERDQIEKIYREQSLSSANTDYLKLGHILGADGLLLLNLVRTPQTTNLMARLIAVKPGVILSDAGFNWPLKDTAQWSDSTAAYLNSFLPKLTVLLKDAIPISVVNLRSALNSTDASETERQLKLLVIQRLSQERQLFVLERQKMQLLSDEKELKADDSAFWDGSYLLEGVVDQNGYSPDIVTINARLTPPKGGAPVLFVASGSRTNLTEVINQLVVKVNGALKIQSTAPAWNAADEAAQFFKEANWALRWGAYTEAQSAADSAWALGKKDLECALVRVKAYLAEVTATATVFRDGETSFSGAGYDADNHPLGPMPSEAKVQKEVNALLKEHPYGLLYRKYENNGSKIITYSFALQPPDPESIDRALRTLEIYYEFCQASSDGQPKILWKGKGYNDWHNSDWYDLGLKNLEAASKVLLSFNLMSAAQPPVADKLTELRALTRSVAALMVQSPTVHDSYFTGERIVTRDELGNTIEESTNVFRCEVKWGCLWQETPEDGIELYRQLLGSPAFSYIHTDFWLRELQMPRLVGWNENDRQRISQVWDRFFDELENSTNSLWRLEAQALTFADADNEQKTAGAFTNFFNVFFENRITLIRNPVEILGAEWGVGDLIERMGGDTSSNNKDLLEHFYFSQYRPEIEAMDREYWNKTIPDRKTVQAFVEQKQYLADFTPYDFQKFVQVFQLNNYTKEQAAELKPLITAYKSNLLAQVSSPTEKFLTGSDVRWIASTLEKTVDQILNPPTPQNLSHLESQVSPLKSAPRPVATVKTVVAVTDITKAPEIVTNIVVVNKFLAIPLDELARLNGLETLNSSNVAVTAHLWLEGKLLLNFKYTLWSRQSGEASGSAIAILDPATEHWEIIDCPKESLESYNRFYYHSALLHGELFTCAAGQIQKYDFQNQQWQTLSVSDGNNYELFVVDGHLYAASRDVIFEILDGGKGTHLMASRRRQPPASAMDSEEWGVPTLFAGPEHSLRGSTQNKIFTWNNNDWREICAAPATSFPNMLFPDAVLFRGNGRSTPHASIWSLATATNQAELCIEENSLETSDVRVAGSSTPRWKLPPELSLPNLSASIWRSGLYLMTDHSEIRDIVNEQHHVIIGKIILPKDGYNATLFCFSQGQPEPQKIYLKFDAAGGCPPPAGEDSNYKQMEAWMGFMEPWMLRTTNFLISGREIVNSLTGDSQPGGYQAGVWLIPLSKIEPVIAAQKQIQQTQLIQAIAVTEQAQKDRFAKYDLNHNGVIDPDEKEAALDDPAFVAWQWDLIDTNQNGQLDLEELAYFDANRNKILEPKEQAGIEIAQHLLAERDLQKFDADEDGALNEQEFGQFLSGLGSVKNYAFASTFYAADANHDRKIDLSELETYLQQQLHRKIRPRGPVGSAFYEMQMQRGKTVDAKELFKEELETYWQNPGSVTNLPSLNHRHQVEQPLLMPQ